jgi:hypothetical protein
MDKQMLDMTRDELSQWNQCVFLEYLFTGNMATGLPIVENNTIRWWYAHCQKQFGELARDVYGDKIVAHEVHTAESESADVSRLAREAAEKIVERSLAYFADLDGEPRTSARAPQTAEKITSIIKSVFAGSDLYRAGLELA